MAIDMSRDVNRLRGEIDDMRKDVTALTRAMRDLGTEKGQEALYALERYGKRARKRVRKAEKRLERRVEERPFLSLLAAFGAGFLFAKILDVGRY